MRPWNSREGCLTVSRALGAEAQEGRERRAKPGHDRGGERESDRGGKAGQGRSGDMGADIDKGAWEKMGNEWERGQGQGKRFRGWG